MIIPISAMINLLSKDSLDPNNIDLKKEPKVNF